MEQIQVTGFPIGFLLWKCWKVQTSLAGIVAGAGFAAGVPGGSKGMKKDALKRLKFMH